MQLNTKPNRADLRNPTGLYPRALSIEELRALLGPRKGPCVSLYLPSRRGGAPEDRNRFEALLGQARALLRKELGEAEVERLLEPIRLLAKPEFWREQTEGLAIFHSADHGALFRLPVLVPERIFVADTFHVRPLLEFLGTNQHYYLLTLSQGRVNFFKGNATGLASVDLSNLPHSLEEALGIEDRERQTGTHQASRGGTQAIVGGTSSYDAVRDEDRARFFRKVDAAIWQILRDEKAPLVLVGPERDVSIYQRIARYPGLAQDSVHGNFAKAPSTELHELAWPIVQKIVAESEQRVIEDYGQLLSRSKALDEIRAIAQFALAGRIRELLLDKDAVRFGTLDRATGALTLHGTQHDAHDDDVLDDIAEAVLLRGGEVFSLPSTRMPTRSPIAATLRW